MYAIVLILFYGTCAYLILFTEDIRLSLDALQEETEHYSNANEPKIQICESRLRMKRDLFTLIGFHGYLKEWVALRAVWMKTIQNFLFAFRVATQCANNFDVFLLFLFYGSVSFWCMILLQIHVVREKNWCLFSIEKNRLNHLCSQCTQEYDSLLMTTTLDEIFILLPFLFLTCHIGENVTTAYAGMNEAMFNISWYLWPVELQQHLVPMILIAGQPVYFNSIVSLNCSHESYKRVIATVHL